MVNFNEKEINIRSNLSRGWLAQRESVRLQIQHSGFYSAAAEDEFFFMLTHFLGVFLKFIGIVHTFSTSFIVYRHYFQLELSTFQCSDVPSQSCDDDPAIF